MTEARQRRLDPFFNNPAMQSSRSQTPYARKLPSLLESPRSSTPTYRTFASRMYHSPSKIFFDSSPAPQSPVTRMSLTFSSSIFAAPLPHKVRFNPYKPIDASSADLFGSETPKQKTPAYLKEPSERSCSPLSSESKCSQRRSKTVCSTHTTPLPSVHDSFAYINDSFVGDEEPESSVSAEVPETQSQRTEPKPRYLEELEAKKAWIAKRREQLGNLTTEQLTTPKKSNKVYSINVAAMHKHMHNSLDIGYLPEPSLIELNLSGLSTTEDEFTVKKACSGLHIVALKTDHDSILGNCKGTASLKLRVHKPEETLDKISFDLASKGWKVNRANTRVGRHCSYAEATNRSFLDNRLQMAERRLRSNEISHRALKLKNLQTSADLFGSTEGAGRWTKNWIESKSREPRKRNVTELQRWDALLKQRRLC